MESTLLKAGEQGGATGHPLLRRRNGL